MRKESRKILRLEKRFSPKRKHLENILAEKKRFSHLPKTFSHEKKLFEKILHKIKRFSHIFSHNLRHNFRKNLAEKILHPNQFSQSRCEHNFISEGGGYTHLKLSLSSLVDIKKSLDFGRHTKYYMKNKRWTML